MYTKVTFRLTPAQKINLQATVKKLKAKKSTIRTQDELGQAIFKRKDLADLVG